MQVRKYEASTIKEAVDMVKRDLGPDAIILSTRENVKNLGNRAGTKTVLVTAAVAEQTYQMKKLVEQNITAREREKLSGRSVKEQREFINQVYGNLKTNVEEKRRKIASRNYASIPDEEEFIEEQEQEVVAQRAPQKMYGRASAPKAQNVTPMQFRRIGPAPVPSRSGQVAVATRPAAAKSQGGLSLVETEETALQEVSPVARKRVKDAVAEAFRASSPLAAKFDTHKIDELKKEIQRLKNILSGTETFTAMAAQAPTHAGAKLGVSSALSPMFEKLIGEGFEEKTIAELLKNAENALKENAKKKSLMDAWVAKWIYSSVDVVKEPLQGRYQFFVGPRGVGKTSTLVKMASHLVIKEKKRIAIITTDTNKVGATEQLRIYSQILNVPFAVWEPGQDLNAILRHMTNIDYVLFDTEGRSLSNMKEIESLKQMIPSNLGSTRVHLVLSALLKDEELYSAARRFKSMNFNDVIFTNVDQLRRHGMLVNFQQHVRSPYFAFSMGPMIPEDFEWASKERVLDLIFKISKSKTEGEKND